MPKRTKMYTDFKPISREVLYNDQFIDSASEGIRLVDNELSNFDNIGGNLISETGGYSRDEDVSNELPGSTVDAPGVIASYTLKPGASIQLFSVPADWTSSKSAPVRTWVYFKTDIATERIDFKLSCGKALKRSSSVENTTLGWTSLSVYGGAAGEQVSLHATSDPTNSNDVVLKVLGWSVFEAARFLPDTPADLSDPNSLIGEIDAPYSSAMAGVLSRNQRAYKINHVPRQMISCCNTWIKSDDPPDAAYSDATNNRGLGTWMVQKRYQVDTLDYVLGMSYYCQGGADTLTVRISANETDGTLIDSVTHILTSTGGVVVTKDHDTDSLDISGAAAANSDIEIRVDVLQTGVSDAWCELDNIVVCERPAHIKQFELEPPDRMDFLPDDDVLAVDIKRLHKMQMYELSQSRTLINQRNRLGSKLYSATTYGMTGSNVFRGLGSMRGDSACSVSDYGFGAWFINPGGNTKKIIAKCTIDSRHAGHYGLIAYDTEAGAGDSLVGSAYGVTTKDDLWVKGATTGAWARAARPASAGMGSGYLILSQLNGAIEYGETLDEYYYNAGWVVTNDSCVAQSYTTNIEWIKRKIVFKLCNTNGVVYRTDVSVPPWEFSGRVVTAEMRIPEDYKEWVHLSDHSDRLMLWVYELSTFTDPTDGTVETMDYRVAHETDLIMTSIYASELQETWY